jgi:hypothetical protein
VHPHLRVGSCHGHRPPAALALPSNVALEACGDVT